LLCMPTPHRVRTTADTNPAPPHGEDCGCAVCRRMSCIVCTPSDVVWVGLPAFSKHVKDVHTATWYEFYKTESISGRPRTAQSARFRRERMLERAETALREARAVDEIFKASKHELRSVPVEAVTDALRSQVAAFASAVKKLPRMREKLFLEAVERVDDAWATPDAYRRALRGLQALVEEASASKKPTVVSKETSFDPRVALEITKLGYAMGKGWSFTVHLLCLYGIDAVVQGLNREGIAPPSAVGTIPSPDVIMRADERRMRFLARHLRLDDDPELAAYGFPDDDYELDQDIGEDRRDEQHRLEVAT
jgi:hypothetical protein